jgi:predicted metalloprotease with PDZ domain
MKYRVSIENPNSHTVKVRLILENVKRDAPLIFFLPTWSPGSYLQRDYSRFISNISVVQENGEPLYFDKITRSEWKIYWDHLPVSHITSHIEIHYEVYCHELTVRTSHITREHAFLHGPSYLIGAQGYQFQKNTIEFQFPLSWSTISTSLRALPEKDKNIYEALNYDTLLDSPVEIGCQSQDFRLIQGKAHYFATFGESFPHKNDLLADSEKIISYISEYMGGMPYDHYTVINHFAAGLYGGLEHSDSTVLHFDGRTLGHRENYLKYIELLSHEYFHTWNIKRIRPIELGPFDYTKENYTKLLWLAEGLTSFMDKLFVYQSGLCSLEEYLQSFLGDIQKYYNTPGRNFDSLDSSSFDAWIKLYKPHENSNNQTISYYLKGGLVFFILNTYFKEQNISMKDFLQLLWNSYKNNTAHGLTYREFFDMLEEFAGQEIADSFWNMVKTTQEIPLEQAFNKMGVSFEWRENNKPYFGANFEKTFEGPRVTSVVIDSPSFKNGLSVGDIILAVNNQSISFEEIHKTDLFFNLTNTYEITIKRLNQITKIDFVFDRSPKELVKLKIGDKELCHQFLMT